LFFTGPAAGAGRRKSMGDNDLKYFKIVSRLTLENADKYSIMGDIQQPNRTGVVGN